MNTRIPQILAEIDQLELALSHELCEETPNESTVLAIKTRLYHLDDVVQRRMALSAKGV